MEQEKELYGICPYATAQKIFTGKWAILIIHHLCERTLRFGELQRRIPGITQAAITKQHRTLEEFGMIHRYVYPEVPPKVEYSLTDIGREFIPVLDQFDSFGNKYIAYMKDQEAVKEHI